MHRLVLKRLVVCAAFLSLVCLVASASAAINIANGKAIIGSGGDYDGNPYNGASLFATQNVTDGQNAADPFNNTGPIAEPDQDGSYWLGPQGSPTGYFVLDLGAPYYIGEIELFNTRNGPYEDRGTRDFSISASNVITLVNAFNGFNLVGGVQIASGQLSPSTYSPGPFGTQGNTPVASNSFIASNSGPFRYIRFDALSIGATGRFGIFGINGVGLNEIRIFATPEPGVAAIFAIVGGIGWFARRKIQHAFS